MANLKIIRELAEKVANDLSVVPTSQIRIYDVELKRADPSELLIYIDCDAGVTLELCEAFSRAIDPMLDEADPIEESYVLCVSSAGADRILKFDSDFAAATGKKVDVSFYKKLENNQKKFTAVLDSFSDSTVTLDGQEYPRRDIAKINFHIDF